MDEHLLKEINEKVFDGKLFDGTKEDAFALFDEYVRELIKEDLDSRGDNEHSMGR